MVERAVIGGGARVKAQRSDFMRCSGQAAIIRALFSLRLPVNPTRYILQNITIG
jgi:hypothetical protein